MVYFVGAGSGAPDLITVRGARLLNQADQIIYAGSLVNPELLDYKKESAVVYDSAKMTLEEVVEKIQEAESTGKLTVRLHTGDPCVYGAIREQMDELDKLNISYKVCPGVSSFCGAASALNLEYTLPGVSQSVIITRMAGRTPVPGRESIASFAAHHATMVIFLSAGMLKKLSEELIKGGYEADTPAAIVYKATWPDEKRVVCTVATLAEAAEQENIKKTAIEEIAKAEDLQTLENARVKYLGKKGELTAVLKGMKDVAPEERPKVGQLVNETRAAIEELLDETKKKMDAAIREEKLKQEVIDVTLPSKKNTVGHRHPNTIALEEVERIFIGMGYEVIEGPEVEYDLYNFEKLNIPANHPAKDEQDTFYINKDIVLRTQTSPVQARIMEQGKLPIRILSPGRVFRSDEVDATHSPSFHQVEGLVVDKGITMADLKGTLDQFAKEFFGEKTKTKFRPHHFPFTEPSAEVDITCFKCGGKGCRVCKGSGWIEILGCGMVHPHVLEMCGIDPEEYSGFAFGIGLERITLLKYEIDDMRLLYENDTRFLNQF